MVSKTERIRARESYYYFGWMLRKIAKKGGNPSLLRDVFNLLNDRRAFGSERSSVYARESVDLLLKEHRKNNKSTK